MIRSLIRASLFIPLLILIIFSGLGVVFLAVNLALSSDYNNGWLGIIYAGLIYGGMALLISSLPTIFFGLPATALAKKYKVLNDRTVLLGATVLGALVLTSSGMLFFDSFTKELLASLAFIGALGGLVNGYVFSKSLRNEN